ncbi:uracil-DNA glycosylase family protein [Streptococcus caprae]|uniref:Uracil-DNA glycosylase family protein n=1 Tax=Streptococcus caprae TaxID=1640501 RepID=A0ABV8CVE5_9STRE
MTLEEVRSAIKEDPQNAVYTEQEIPPLFQVDSKARVLIIGQAPGLKAQERGQLFQDASGQRLRDWLGVDESIFYDSGQIAILPMDFYYPGKGKSGDLPPRPGFAEKWHPVLLREMPDIQLTLLIGQYAQAAYLKTRSSLTETVQHFEDFLPEFFPLAHPSPRNNIWLAKNPWYQAQLLPRLKEEVARALKKS